MQSSIVVDLNKYRGDPTPNHWRVLAHILYSVYALEKLDMLDEFLVKYKGSERKWLAGFLETRLMADLFPERRGPLASKRSFGSAFEEPAQQQDEYQ